MIKELGELRPDGSGEFDPPAAGGKAVVLLSGGLRSVVALGEAQARGLACHVVTVAGDPARVAFAVEVAAEGGVPAARLAGMVGDLTDPAAWTGPLPHVVVEARLFGVEAVELGSPAVLVALASAYADSLGAVVYAGWTMRPEPAGHDVWLPLLGLSDAAVRERALALGIDLTAYPAVAA